MSLQNRDLDICSDGHESVAYANGKCPACELQADNIAAHHKLQSLKVAYDELEAKLNDYEADYVRWKEVVDKLEGKPYG